MIVYAESVENVSPEQLKGFFVGWENPFSPEKHLEILRGSTHIIVAVDSSNDKVIGFVNAMSDGVSCAYIPFIEVLPGYQKKGIGSELMKRMLTKIKDLYMIDTMCDEDMVSFYEKFGMHKAIGMIIRNHQ